MKITAPGLAGWLAIITAILVVNNLRDLENDRKAGKHTLAVILGEQATKTQYLICIVAAYLVLPVAATLGLIPWTSLLAWLSLPIAVRASRLVLTSLDESWLGVSPFNNTYGFATAGDSPAAGGAL